MKLLEHQRDLEGAVDRLVKAEPRFAMIVVRHGLPPLRQAEPGLKSLLRIVTDQLISLKSGAAIWTRILNRFDAFTADEILACPENELRALGLSGAKARTFHAVAHAFRARILLPDIFLAMEEQETVQRLTSIQGIGPWTANLYLLTALRAADAWPAADIALQHAAHDLFGLSHRPEIRELTRMAVPWQPYRSAAALLLWHHYRALRHLPQA